MSTQARPEPSSSDGHKDSGGGSYDELVRRFAGGPSGNGAPGGLMNFGSSIGLHTSNGMSGLYPNGGSDLSSAHHHHQQPQQQGTSSTTSTTRQSQQFRAEPAPMQWSSEEQFNSSSNKHQNAFRFGLSLSSPSSAAGYSVPPPPESPIGGHGGAWYEFLPSNNQQPGGVVGNVGGATTTTTTSGAPAQSRVVPSFHQQGYQQPHMLRDPASSSSNEMFDPSMTPLDFEALLYNPDMDDRSPAPGGLDFSSSLDYQQYVQHQQRTPGLNDSIGRSPSGAAAPYGSQSFPPPQNAAAAAGFAHPQQASLAGAATTRSALNKQQPHNALDIPDPNTIAHYPPSDSFRGGVSKFVGGTTAYIGGGGHHQASFGQQQQQQQQQGGSQSHAGGAFYGAFPTSHQGQFAQPQPPAQQTADGYMPYQQVVGHHHHHSLRPTDQFPAGRQEGNNMAFRPGQQVSSNRAPIKVTPGLAGSQFTDGGGHQQGYISSDLSSSTPAFPSMKHSPRAGGGSVGPGYHPGGGAGGSESLSHSQGGKSSSNLRFNFEQPKRPPPSNTQSNSKNANSGHFVLHHHHHHHHHHGPSQQSAAAPQARDGPIKATKGGGSGNTNQWLQPGKLSGSGKFNGTPTSATGTNQNSNKGNNNSKSDGLTVDVEADPEDPVAKKRAELVESPSTRVKFKEFYRLFRAKEKEGFKKAFNYAKESLETLPAKIKWRVYLEMADLSKRENKFALARKLYERVNTLQPYAPQGWLEYSKMEEECGQLPHCQQILHEGLKYCSFSESLLTKAIKHEERMGNLKGARALLARLRNQSVDKAWRTVLEGALLEARAGHTVVARKVFKYLMQNVPWYGPIYHEAARFEERNEYFDRAIVIVERGLREIPRYGPLWFNAFRLYERIEALEAAKKCVSPSGSIQFWKENVGEDLHFLFGIQGDELGPEPVFCKLEKTRVALQRAMSCISKELVWKVHFDAAQVAERGGGEDRVKLARESYVQSVLRCPMNLQWKVWLAGARMELATGNVDAARMLLGRALEKVPDKSRPQVLLECSRLEEYTDHLDVARAVLASARRETKHEWKVFLETVMLETRAGNRNVAIEEAEKALKIHSGTGRLWAILVQLKHAHGPEAQRAVFRDALKQVPKSGEVWCEGARVRMHPLSPHFDLQTAERFLQFAIQFTPQYGDSFIEALRLRLMLCDDETTETATEARKAMWDADTSALEQRCVNADPNYGALWFHCKRGPFDTARQVMRVAKRLLIAELIHFRDVIRVARGLKRGTVSEEERKQKDKRGSYVPSDERNFMVFESVNRDHWVQERLELLPEENKYCFDFSTGLVNVNWFRERVYLLNDEEKRKILFGSDQIVP